jgi:uncharacterized coiled-coil protein SlyX
MTFVLTLAKHFEEQAHQEDLFTSLCDTVTELRKNIKSKHKSKVEQHVKHDQLEQDWNSLINGAYHKQYPCHPFVRNIEYKTTHEEHVKNQLLELLDGDDRMGDTTITDEMVKITNSQSKFKHDFGEPGSFDRRLYDILSISKSHADKWK